VNNQDGQPAHQPKAASDDAEEEMRSMMDFLFQKKLLMTTLRTVAAHLLSGHGTGCLLSPLISEIMPKPREQHREAAVGN
jgi:hypothetical protein